MSHVDPATLYFHDFVVSARSTLDELNLRLAAVTASDGDAEWEPITRAFHSIKGNSAFYEGCTMTPLAKAAEFAARGRKQIAASDFDELVGLLRQAQAKLAELVGETERQRAAVRGDGPTELIEALERFTYVDRTVYLLFGNDVTQDVKLLTSCVGSDSVDPRLGDVARRLAGLARAVENHEVARVLEGVGDGDNPTLQLRTALRTLAPHLVTQEAA